VIIKSLQNKSKETINVKIGKLEINLCLKSLAYKNGAVSKLSMQVSRKEKNIEVLTKQIGWEFVSYLNGFVEMLIRILG
jgi:hypothetical protein